MGKIILRLLITIFSIFGICNSSFASDTSYYKGRLIIDDSIQFSYIIRYAVEPKSGDVIGYSLLDANGPMETKCKIKGYYNKYTETLTFQEFKILRTSIDTAVSPFYFAQVILRSNKSNTLSAMEGTFARMNANNSVQQGKAKLIDTNLSEKTKKKFNKAKQRFQKDLQFPKRDESKE